MKLQVAAAVLAHVRISVSLSLINTWKACNGGVYIYDATNDIMSPNYPDVYPNHLMCSWWIRAPEGKVITGSVLSLDIEAVASSCPYDYMALFSDRLYCKLCGRSTNVLNFTTPTNYFNVYLFTDAAYQKQGFHIKYNFEKNYAASSSLSLNSTISDSSCPIKMSALLPTPITNYTEATRLVRLQTTTGAQTNSSQPATGLHTIKPLHTTSSMVTNQPEPETESTEAPGSTESRWTNSGIEISDIRCDSYSIELEVSATPSFPVERLREATLADPLCSYVNVSGNKVVFRTPLDGCSTRRLERTDAIMYVNELVIREPNLPGAVINRRKDLHVQIPFECIMPRLTHGVQSYKVAYAGTQSPVIARGEYSLSIEFYTDSDYQHKVRSFPFIIDIDNDLYIKLRLLSADMSLKLAPRDCWATPTASPNGTSYPLIVNRCISDPTVSINLAESNINEYRFSLHSFEFMGSSDVFIHCTAIVCDLRDVDGGCRRSCDRSRRRRSTQLFKDRVELLQGPLVLLYDASGRRDRMKGEVSWNPTVGSHVIGITISAGIVACVIFIAVVLNRH